MCVNYSCYLENVLLSYFKTKNILSICSSEVSLPLSRRHSLVLMNAVQQEKGIHITYITAAACVCVCSADLNQ